MPYSAQNGMEHDMAFHHTFQNSDIRFHTFPTGTKHISRHGRGGNPCFLQLSCTLISNTIYRVQNSGKSDQS